MHAVRLLGQHLPDVARHDDAAVRGELVLAAVLCGQGTDHTGAGITTVLGHAIGARHDLENGTVNAIVLPHALRFNARGGSRTGQGRGGAGPAAQRRRAAAAEGREGGAEIFGTLDVPPRLRDVGVPREALPAIAATAMGDWFLRGNPRPVRDARELQDVLETAW